MKKNLRIITGGLGAIVALVLGACAYDPYYSGGSVAYSSYGYGHGYGGSSFSTSVFVSTGDPRWGYDPYCRSYYDYHRRAYYDPYLYGYYPVGYRPPVIIGVPHPHGWRPGSRYCPPPQRVTTVTLRNYNNREGAYRGLNHSWARQARMAPAPQRGTAPQRRDDRGGYDRGGNQRDGGPGRTFGPRDSRTPGSAFQGNRGGWNEPPTFDRGDRAPDANVVQSRRQPRAPSNYNTPVEARPSQRPEVIRPQFQPNPGGLPVGPATRNQRRSPGTAPDLGRPQAPAPPPPVMERPQPPTRDENPGRGGGGGGDRGGRVRGLGQG